MQFQDKQALERYRERLEMIRRGSSINPNETKQQQRERIERAKKDYAFFVSKYFPHYADAECADFHVNLANRVKRNKVIRELVRWGRGLAKSVHCDITIPIWLWINGESMYELVVGNSYDKAEILLSDVQAEFEANPLLIRDFGEQKLNGCWEGGDFQTRDGRFIGKALGMGQSPRGLRVGSRRPNYIVADDLEDKDTSKNPKRQDEVVDWIERDLIPTMDGEVRRYLHPNNDPWPRSIQNQLEAKHPNWHLDLIKAYDPITYKPAWHQKYSDTYYKDVEEDIGKIAALAEYNHEPHVKGKIFTDEQIQWAKAPRIDHYQIIMAHWDPAYSGFSDYNAVKVWALYGRQFWHIKAFVRRCKMADAIRFMYDYEEEIKFRCEKPIIVHWRVESQFWNDPMRQALHEVEKEKGRPLNIVVKDRSTANKYDRILTLQPYFQNSRIYYDEREKGNNDMQMGIAQLKGIEPGYKTHDDGPDADQQAIEELAGYLQQDAFEPRITHASDIRGRSRNRY